MILTIISLTIEIPNFIFFLLIYSVNPDNSILLFVLGLFLISLFFIFLVKALNIYEILNEQHFNKMKELKIITFLNNLLNKIESFPCIDKYEGS